VGDDWMADLAADLRIEDGRLTTGRTP